MFKKYKQLTTNNPRRRAAFRPPLAWMWASRRLSVSGLGNFSYWIEKLQEHYLRKTEMNLFPGTLNIQLDHPYSLPNKVIRLEKEEYRGTASVNIVPCNIFGRAAFILRTDKNESGYGEYPKTIVEIACDVKLRDKYNLEDGNTVEVEVGE